MYTIAAIIAADDKSWPSFAWKRWHNEGSTQVPTCAVSLFLTTYLLLHCPNYLTALGDVHLDFVKVCYDLVSNAIFRLMDLSLNDRALNNQMRPAILHSFVCLSSLMLAVVKSGTELRSKAVWQYDNHICESRQCLTCQFQFWIAWAAPEPSRSMRLMYDVHLCPENENKFEPFSAIASPGSRKRTALSEFGAYIRVGSIDHTASTAHEDAFQPIADLVVQEIPASILVFSKTGF
jgi:hypothetical protein